MSAIHHRLSNGRIKGDRWDQHTIDGFIARNSHHCAGAVRLLAELNTMLNQPILVFLGPDSALDPARGDIVNADSLLPAATSDGLHETAKAILCGCVFPIALLHGSVRYPRKQ